MGAKSLRPVELLPQGSELFDGQQILRTAYCSCHTDQVVARRDEDAIAEQLEGIGRASKVVVSLRGL